MSLLHFLLISLNNLCEEDQMMNMRRFTILVAGFALMLAAVAGCSAPAAPPSAAGKQAIAEAAPEKESAAQASLPPVSTQEAPAETPAATEPAEEQTDPVSAGSKTDPAPAKPQETPAAAESKLPEAAPTQSQIAPAPVPAASSASATAEAPAAVPASPPAAGSEPPETASVYLSIVGDAEKGTILEETAVAYEEGDTVVAVLRRAAEQNGIDLEIRGFKGLSYVEGIDKLYEFDQGPKSGWVYSVNGELPSKGSGSYKPEAGDRIAWLYTLDLGKDVNQSEDGA